MSFPRWIVGNPSDGGIAPAMLREVGEGLYVGSANAEEYLDATECTWAVMQFSEGNRPASEHVPNLAAYLRTPFRDSEPVPPDVLVAALAVATLYRGKCNVLAQCRAGLSRSASVAYMILREMDGLSHDEALACVFVRQEHYEHALNWPNAVTLASVRAWVES